ncbi:helix-turn-helix domain-containing protein [Flavobacterium sp. U410]|jgi:transcriptional regulator with XRE-family HTH domain
MNNQLKELRLKKELTQENVAFELGISQKAYSKIENAQVCLSQEKMLKLSKLYNVAPDFFCDISCECNSNKQVKLDRIMHFLSQKGIELPDFLK